MGEYDIDVAPDKEIEWFKDNFGTHCSPPADDRVGLLIEERVGVDNLREHIMKKLKNKFEDQKDTMLENIRSEIDKVSEEHSSFGPVINEQTIAETFAYAVDSYTRKFSHDTQQKASAIGSVISECSNALGKLMAVDDVSALTKIISVATESVKSFLVPGVPQKPYIIDDFWGRLREITEKYVDTKMREATAITTKLLAAHPYYYRGANYTDFAPGKTNQTDTRVHELLQFVKTQISSDIDGVMKELPLELHTHYKQLSGLVKEPQSTTLRRTELQQLYEDLRDIENDLKKF